MGLKEHSKGVTTPGVNDEAGEEQGEVNETLYRAIAARANYSRPVAVGSEWSACAGT